MPEMVNCPSCGQPTPQATFCVRCGEPLADGEHGAPGARRAYAAAPHQSVARPALVATLFPHLPRSSHRGFGVALAFGSAVVAALAALRLFPAALIVAALMMPLLVVLYLIDVDVYEDEPVWAIALSLAWGALTGVGFGLLARALDPTAADVIVHGRSAFVLGDGIALPLAGLAVLLAGPLVLLRYHRFNDVLDGVTFGAAAAAAYAGAEAVTYAVRLLGSGLRPDGAVLPWIWRLLALGVAMPVLTMGAAAAVCAAVWLRYRSPARDEYALGPAGHPALALPLAAGLVVAGAVVETLVPAGVWLGCLAVLDAVALVLLRRAIHVGLLQESLELPIGPELTCPNCGAATVRHTFCQNCGISLQALPKARGAGLGGGRPETAQ